MHNGALQPNLKFNLPKVSCCMICTYILCLVLYWANGLHSVSLLHPSITDWCCLLHLITYTSLHDLSCCSLNSNLPHSICLFNVPGSCCSVSTYTAYVLHSFVHWTLLPCLIYIYHLTLACLTQYYSVISNMPGLCCSVNLHSVGPAPPRVLIVYGFR